MSDLLRNIAARLPGGRSSSLRFILLGWLATIPVILFVVLFAFLIGDAEWASAIANITLVTISVLAFVAAARQLSVWKDQHLEEQNRDLARRVLSAALAWRQMIDRARAEVPLQFEMRESQPTYVFPLDRVSEILKGLESVRVGLITHGENLTALLYEAQIVWGVSTDPYFRQVKNTGETVLSELQSLAQMAKDSIQGMQSGAASLCMPVSAVHAAIPWIAQGDLPGAQSLVTTMSKEACGAIVQFVSPRLNSRRFEPGTESGP